MANSDISELYNIDVSNYEFAAVREKYGSWLISSDYFNAGVLLLNMKLIKETGLFEKARKLLRECKLIFADQDAIYYNITKKLLLPRKFNEQSKFNRKTTVLCHFCKRWFLDHIRILKMLNNGILIKYTKFSWISNSLP